MSSDETPQCTVPVVVLTHNYIWGIFCSCESKFLVSGRKKLRLHGGLMKGKFFDDFNVGDKFVTSRRTLTEYDLETFCNLVWFNLSMFFDDIYAKEEMPYRSRVFPGPLIIPFAVGLFLKLGIYEKTVIALLGIQDMKFKTPLRIGDTMQVDVEILEKKDSKANFDRGVLIVQFIVNKVLSMADKEFIMSFEMAHMLKKR